MYKRIIFCEHVINAESSFYIYEFILHTRIRLFNEQCGKNEYPTISGILILFPVCSIYRKNIAICIF